MSTLSLPKEELVMHAQAQMRTHLDTSDWSLKEKVALTCRILFGQGHDSGLAGQITARVPGTSSFITQRLASASTKSASPTCCVSTRT